MKIFDRAIALFKHKLYNNKSNQITYYKLMKQKVKLRDDKEEYYDSTNTDIENTKDLS